MKKAFTLAEVLITVAVIGVVAVLAIFKVYSEYQKMIFKSQFKKEHNTLTKAMMLVSEDMYHKPDCYYWEKNPYGRSECISYDSNNKCTGYKIQGSNTPGIPDDYTGRMGECNEVKAAMQNRLQVEKVCKNHAYENGCIPDYKGKDTVYRENHPGISEQDVQKAMNGCGSWQKNYILNDREAWVLNDGAIIVFYSGFQLFFIDVNGKKGPNKWGYDIVSVTTVSSIDSPFIKFSPGNGCGSTEKGGMDPSEYLK